MDEARGWVGTPYHHHARVKGAGVDCGMLLIEVYARAGVVPQFDPGDYSPQWFLHRDEDLYLGWVERFCVPTEEPQPADIALFKFGRTNSHAGIIIDWPLMIHAYRESRSVVYEDVSASGEIKGRLTGFWRVKDEWLIR